MFLFGFWELMAELYLWLWVAFWVVKSVGGLFQTYSFECSSIMPYADYL